jgi:hypothetical protein
MAKKTRKYATMKSDLPPVWNPREEGATLEGIYIGSKRLNLGFDRKTRETNWMVTFQIQNEETGEVYSVSGTVLERLFKRVKISTPILLTFLGMKRSGGGNETKIFELAYDEDFADQISDEGLEDISADSDDSDDSDDEDYEPEPAPESRKGKDAKAKSKARAAVNA